MEKGKILVTIILVGLLISFGFPSKTFAVSNQSGSSVGIYFENDYTPQGHLNPSKPTDPTNNGKTSYPNMGEIITKSIPYFGIILILLVSYLHFKNRKKHKQY